MCTVAFQFLELCIIGINFVVGTEMAELWLIFLVMGTKMAKRR